MGNPYGKDVFKYGSDDWQAKRYNDEWKAAKHPPVSDSSNSTWSPSNPSQYTPEIPALNVEDPPPLPGHPRGRTSRVVGGGDKFDSCGGRKSDSRQHGLAAG